MKKVLIRPSFQDWCENKLFTQGTSFNSIYKEAFCEWKQTAAIAGYQLNTWDKMPLKEADIFWFLDLPTSRKEFEHIRTQLRPDVPIVLQVLESPVVSICSFLPKNTQHFDAVLSYEHSDDIDDRDHYFSYKLPSEPVLPVKNLTYSDRKGLLLVNSNRVEGFWSIRQPGLSGLPALGKLVSGWHCPPSALAEVLHGELYSRRRSLAKLAEKMMPDFLDIYGHGWNGEQISWCPLYPKRRYKCWRGPSSLSKAELCEQYRFVLSFENFKGSRGYISEKILEPMFSGSVPVYMGDERISDYIPQETFVDGNRFNSDRALLNYLDQCSESEWICMREAGQAFVRSESAQLFYSDNFVKSAMSVLENTLSQ